MRKIAILTTVLCCIVSSRAFPIVSTSQHDRHKQLHQNHDQGSNRNKVRSAYGSSNSLSTMKERQGQGENEVLPFGLSSLTNSSSRRHWISGIVLVSAPLLSTLSPHPHLAWAAEAKPLWNKASTDHPVAVVGAGGRTGMEVLQALARESIPTVSMTRTGKNPFQVIKLPPEVQSYISHYENDDNQVDVTQLKSLDQAMVTMKEQKRLPSALIFCASASKQGGSAFQVDDVGVGNAATIAKKYGLRLIVVSALAVDRPDSKSFQITNTIGGNFNGIMDAKRQGEQKVRQTTKDYVIVRPGPLLKGKTYTGAAGMQVNQGDTIGGGLSRDELAGLVVGALRSGLQGATVEVYRRSTATKLQPDFTMPSGFESSSEGVSSYDDLFPKVRLD